MGFLDEARVEADVAADHVLDHNDIHQYLNAQRNLEAAVHADSDYFDDESIAAYTELDITGATIWAEKYGLLSVRYNTIASNDVSLLGKAMTASGPPVTIEVEVEIHTPTPSINSVGAGIFFSNGVVSGSAVCDLTIFFDSAGLVASMRSGTATSHSTAEGTAILGPANWDTARTGKYHLRLTWDSANTFSAYYSIDRVSWEIVFEGAAFTLTPDTIGFSLLCSGDGSLSMASFRNFEVSEADPGQAT